MFVKSHPTIFDTVITSKNIEVSNFKNGVNHIDEFIIIKNYNHYKVYDRICDHAGGRLISKKGDVICPLHNWCFDVESGLYDNGKAKEPIFNEEIGASDTYITVKSVEQHRRLPVTQAESKVRVTFLSHASIMVETDEVSFITDPWFVGEAFLGGWLPAIDPPSNWETILNSVDFVFISHNHPDHLHIETLNFLDRKMPIVTGKFSSGSTYRYLKNLGFDNVHACSFNKDYFGDGNMWSISVVKSGDFRDDAGTYFTSGDFSILLASDCNFIDNWRFPLAPVTLVATAFAGGASGFPLCFENYSFDEKIRIIARNRAAIFQMVRKVLENGDFQFYLPYAGFFREDDERDPMISKYNSKNTAESYGKLAAALEIGFLNPLEYDTYEFDGMSLINKSNSLTRVELDKRRQANNVPELDFDSPEVVSHIQAYFNESGFFADLDLHVILCNEDFSDFFADFYVSFSKTMPPVFKKISERRPHVNYLRLKVRSNAFISTINDGLPWEDLSIGFNISVYREPNIYNADFWYHFTNVYVADNVKKMTSPCNICTTLNQLIY